MRILVISRYENFIRHRSEAEIFIRLAELGVSITIMTTPNSPFYDIFSQVGIKVVPHHPETRFSKKSILPIREELLIGNYDILHLFNSKSIPAGIIASRGINIKIITYRGAKGPYWHDISAYFGHYHPRVNAIICLSEYVKSSILAQGIMSSKKLHVIHKGVDISWFNSVSPATYDFQKSNLNCKIITCVAHLRPVKGVDFLVQAAKMLSGDGDLHFVFIGRGTNDPDFQRKLSKLPNHKRLHGIGEVEDIRSHMKACDIYVQPSISEGLGKTVIEAMAYSKPIIVTRCGGPEEIIQDQMSGEVVPVKNADALANSIINFLKDMDRAKRMGQSAKSFLIKKLNIELTVDKTSKVYRSLLIN